MTKRAEDKVLFEVGYHDKLWREEERKQVKYADMVSEVSIPSLSSLDPAVHKRPHSVHKFKPGKDDEDLMSSLDFDSAMEEAWGRSLQRM